MVNKLCKRVPRFCPTFLYFIANELQIKTIFGFRSSLMVSIVCSTFQKNFNIFIWKRKEILASVLWSTTYLGSGTPAPAGPPRHHREEEGMAGEVQQRAGQGRARGSHKFQFGGLCCGAGTF